MSPEVLKIFAFLGNILDIVQIFIPILLVILGSFDLLKAMSTAEDNQISKAKTLLFKRLLVGVSIFFLPALVSLLVNMASGDDDNIYLKCFLDVDICNEKINNPEDLSTKIIIYF